jgi:hypothetical protein
MDVVTAILSFPVSAETRRQLPASPTGPRKKS